MSSDLGAYEQAVFDEVAKKAGLLWIGYGEPLRHHPVWHQVVNGIVCVVAGGEEQPLPGIEEQDRVELVLRTKTDRHRVLGVEATVERLTPDHDEWDAVTKALVGGRLNLVDRARAPQRWAEHAWVLRFHPVRVTQSGDELPNDSLAQPPVGSPAVTARTSPRIWHRLQSQRRRLS